VKLVARTGCARRATRRVEQPRREPRPRPEPDRPRIPRVRRDGGSADAQAGLRPF
jgi:hypothetical protein